MYFKNNNNNITYRDFGTIYCFQASTGVVLERIPPRIRGDHCNNLIKRILSIYARLEDAKQWGLKQLLTYSAYYVH